MYMRRGSALFRRDDDHATHAEAAYVNPAEELIFPWSETIGDVVDRELVTRTEVPREPERRDRHVVEVLSLVIEHEVLAGDEAGHERRARVGIVEVVVDRRDDVGNRLGRPQRHGGERDRGHRYPEEGQAWGRGSHRA